MAGNSKLIGTFRMFHLTAPDPIPARPPLQSGSRAKSPMQCSQVDSQIAALQSENATLQHELKQSRQVHVVWSAIKHVVKVLTVLHVSTQ